MPSPFRRAAVIVFALALAFSAFAQEQTLYRFHGAGDGSNPISALIADGAGNLYGTTEFGGASFYGTVFQLVPPKSGGAWTENTLYSFSNTGDGARPTAGLVFDISGNLFGTTSDSAAGGFGEVFELSPANGSWTYQVLYSFRGETDGSGANGPLLIDSAGNLFGSTATSVYELSPPASGGNWTFTLLHGFHCCTHDGWSAVGNLARDSQGNLYGATLWGGYEGNPNCGSVGCGTVFALSPPARQGDPWSEKVIHYLGLGKDGLNPTGGVSLDSQGNLYGTTYSGGTKGGGTVWKLAPQSDGTWAETVLHNFDYGFGGGAPQSTPILDSAGNLYGTATFGGNRCIYNGTAYGCGVVFELSPGTNGSWTETDLYRFLIGIDTPKQPQAGLLFDQHGNLYGTTTWGGFNACTGDGSNGCGTVFRILR